MCFSGSAQPPAPPVRGEIGARGDLVLTSRDGTEFAAYYAHPAVRSNVGVVIMPDVRGLHDFYRRLAERVAEAGMHAIAIDYFGRTAGVGPRGEDFPHKKHVDQLQPEAVADDVSAAISWLRSEDNAGAESIFTLGFCRGGALSWRQSAASHNIQGCIGFYGIPSLATDQIPLMREPILILAAGRDITPVGEIRKFAEDVRSTGVEVDIHVYSNATHSFFDRKFAEYSAECDDSWRRIISFIEHHRV